MSPTRDRFSLYEGRTVERTWVCWSLPSSRRRVAVIEARGGLQRAVCSGRLARVVVCPQQPLGRPRGVCGCRTPVTQLGDGGVGLRSRSLCVRCVLGVESSFAAAQSSDTASFCSCQLVLVFVFVLLSLMEHFALFSPVLCRV